jgi:hypothetical protein
MHARSTYFIGRRPQLKIRDADECMLRLPHAQLATSRMSKEHLTCDGPGEILRTDDRERRFDLSVIQIREPWRYDVHAGRQGPGACCAGVEHYRPAPAGRSEREDACMHAWF